MLIIDFASKNRKNKKKSQKTNLISKLKHHCQVNILKFKILSKEGKTMIKDQAYNYKFTYKANHIIKQVVILLYGH